MKVNRLKKIAYVAFGFFCCIQQKIRAENEKEATATIEVKCIVPFKCAVDLQDTQIHGNELTIRTLEKCHDCQYLKQLIKKINVYERCNTQRNMKISKGNETNPVLVIQAY